MTVEELQVIIRANNKDFKTKIDEVNKKISGLKAGADSGNKSVKGLSGGIAAIKTAAAVAALKMLASSIKKVTDAYSQRQAAEMGLESILTAQNKSVNEAKQFLQDYTKDGLIPLQDAYLSYKQLAAAGYTDEQTKSILENLKNAAAFSRQSHLTMGEAVRTATEGIKSENSILVDNAGVTKNLSVMWKEYAASIGKGVQSLTAEEKRLATVQGIMRETAFQTGDAAKYASTYAGAQAALKAQTTQLSAALGSIFAPMLQSITPIITRQVAKLTELADRIGQIMALLFGVNAKKDAATVALGQGADRAAAGISTAASKAKELKRTLLGIDEMNILTKPASESGSGAGSGATTQKTALDTTVRIDPALDNKLSELTAKAEKFKDRVEAWMPTIKGVASAGGVALGIGIVSKLVSAANKVPLLHKGFSLLKGSVLTATKAFRSGVGPLKATGAGFKALWSSAKGFAGSMSPMAKLGGSLVALTAQFVVTKNAVKDLVLGNIDAKQAMFNIIPVAGAVGVALYMMLGPWGLVLGAVTLVAAAMKGVNDAQIELQNQAINNAFYNGTGEKISDIAAKFTAMSDAIVASNQPIIDNQSVIDETKTRIGETARQIDLLISGVDNGVYSVETAAPKIKDAFAQLKADTEIILEAIYENITYSLAGSIGNVLESMGVDLPKINELLGSIIGDTKTKLKSLTDEAGRVTEKLKGATGDEKFALTLQLGELNRKIQEIAGTDDIKNLSVQLERVKDNLDLNDPTAFKKAMEEIGAAADTAKGSLSNATDALSGHAQWLQDNAKTQAQFDAATLYAEAIKEDYRSSVAKIDAQMKTVADGIMTSFATQYGVAVKEAEPTILEKARGWLWRLLGAPPGIADKTTQDAMKKRVLDTLLTKEMKDAFEKSFGEYGKSSIAGLKNGLLYAAADSNKAAKEVAQQVQNSFKDELQINSPSKKFRTFGMWTVEGYVHGIKDKTTIATGAADTLGSKVVETLSTIMSYKSFLSIGETAAKGISDAFKNMTLPKIKVPHFSIQYNNRASDSKDWEKLGIGGRPQVDVKWYGKGGVFDSASVIGVGEKGKEAVLPLEQNTGWMDTLADKIGAKTSSSTSEGGNWTIILQRADGTEEGRVMISAAERKNRRDGRTIIPVGV